MAIVEGTDFTHLSEKSPSARVRKYNHAVDIAESIWNRMEELGMSQADLARRLKKSRSQVSRMLSVQGNMTLQTISELESALGITLADTTPYEPASASEEYRETRPPKNEWREASAELPDGVYRLSDWGMVA